MDHLNDSLTDPSRRADAPPAMAGPRRSTLQGNAGRSQRTTRRLTGLIVTGLLLTGLPAATAGSSPPGAGIQRRALEVPSRLLGGASAVRVPGSLEHSMTVSLPGGERVVADPPVELGSDEPAVRVVSRRGRPVDFSVLRDDRGLVVESHRSGGGPRTWAGAGSSDLHAVALTLLDRSGQPWDPDDHPGADPTVQLFNRSGAFFQRLVVDRDGRASAHVPPGRYSIFARIVSPADPPASASTSVVIADVDVRAEASVVLDARAAEPLRAPRVQGHRVRLDGGLLVYTATTGGDYPRRYSEAVALDPSAVARGHVYLTPTTPTGTGEFEALVRWSLEARPVQDWKPIREFDLLLDADHVGPAISPTLAMSDLRSLARVDRLVHPIAARGAHQLSTMALTTVSHVTTTVTRSVEPPWAETRFVNTGENHVRYDCVNLELNAGAGPCGQPAPGVPHDEGDGEFGGAVHAAPASVRRYLNRMAVDLGIGDGAHRTTVDMTRVPGASTELFDARTGQLLGGSPSNIGDFPVPAGPRRLRLVHDLQMRGSGFHAADRTRSTWTFTSTPPNPGEQLSTLAPLLFVDYGPRLTDGGAAPSRGPLRLDLDVRRLDLATERRPRVADIRLAWATEPSGPWRRTAVARHGSSFTALLTGTAWRGGRSLSLRIRVVDGDGNRLTQEAIAVIPTP